MSITASRTQIDNDHDIDIATAWRRQVQHSTRHTALIFEYRHWSYDELHRASCHAARLLAAEGLVRGERVILMMDNGPVLLAAFFGCQMLGLVPVPVCPRSSVQRLRYLLADSEAELVLIEPSLHRRIVQLHRGQEYGARVHTLAPKADADEATGDEDGFTLPARAAEIEGPVLDPGEIALIQYTSGSSADSKGVMISHRAALANVRAFGERLQLDGFDVFSSLLPLFDDMGLMCFGLAPLLLGHPLVLYRSGAQSLTAWLAGIEAHRVTITGAPDSLLQVANRVIDRPSQYALHSLRLLIFGSEPLRRHGLEIFGTRFGCWRALKPAYGMAELTSCVTLTPAGEPPRIDARGNVSAGRPIAGVQLRIAGGTALRSGACGEILVRSPAAMSGYWECPTSSAEAFDGDGWLHTGDLGYLDDDGYLYVLGRLGNLLIRAGERHCPHDLEAAAMELAPVRRAAVVQSRLADARILAVIEVERALLQDTAFLAALARQVRTVTAAHAGLAPDACLFVGPDSIPITENGKLRHAELRGRIDRRDFPAISSETLPAQPDAAFIASPSQGQRHVAAVA